MLYDCNLSPRNRSCQVPHFDAAACAEIIGELTKISARAAAAISRLGNGGGVQIKAALMLKMKHSTLNAKIKNYRLG